MPAKIIFSEKEKNKIINLYKQDYTPKKISEEFGVSVFPIKTLLKEEKIYKPARFSTLSYRYMKYIHSKSLCNELYEKCITLSEFCSQLECGHDMGRSILKYHGIKILRSSEIFRDRYPIDESKLIHDYLNNDMSVNKLKKKYKAATETIKDILIRHNIEIVPKHIKQLSKEAKSALKDINYARGVYESTLGIREFSNKLSCSYTVAHRINETHNLGGFSIKVTRNKKWLHYFHKKFKNFEIIKKDGYYLTIKHNKCKKSFNMTTQTPLKWEGDDLCPRCNSRYKTSKFENEIKKFLKKNNISIKSNRKSILNHRGLELDIFSEDHDIAIECCGLYWHSNIFKDKKSHLEKLKLCKEKNIKLITIFEDEWHEKQNIVKNKLLHAFNLNNKKVYARNCRLVINLNKRIGREFLKNNHIQGEDRAKTYFGLYHDNELVAVASFKHPNMSTNNVTNNKNIYEISRYCTSVNVVGGFSKILSNFIKENNPEKITTFADRRWGEGDVYTKMGFNFIHSTSPNYWYTKSLNRIHRYTFAKHKLIEQYPEYEHLTEREIVEKKLKYNRIYDCGSNKFELIL